LVAGSLSVRENSRRASVASPPENGLRLGALAMPESAQFDQNFHFQNVCKFAIENY